MDFHRGTKKSSIISLSRKRVELETIVQSQGPQNMCDVFAVMWGLGEKDMKVREGLQVIWEGEGAEVSDSRDEEDQSVLYEWMKKGSFILCTVSMRPLKSDTLENLRL